jgi:hypothetical protein
MILLLVTLFIYFSVAAIAQAVPDAPTPQVSTESYGAAPAGSATNNANNPLTPKLTLVMQNYLVPSTEGYNGRMSDEELFRFYVPFKLFGVNNITRIYQPVFKDPVFPQGTDGGLGDSTIFDLAETHVQHLTLGAGPLLVIPTASHPNMGSGKWQAGGATIAVDEAKWGLAGAIFTYQHSFTGVAGEGPRNTAELITLQPIIRYNFRKGYYLRSTGFWNFNPHSGVNDIPIGMGLGKVWTMRDGATANLYCEPQYSVWQSGTGSPRLEILNGLTIQFPHHQQSKVRDAFQPS